MSKARKWVKPLLVCVAFLAFIIWDTKRGAEIDRKIELHGAKAHAVVVRTYFTRGVAMDLKFFHNGKSYIATSQHATFQVAPGDSVSILFLPNNVGSEILLEKRIFTVPRKP